MKILRSIPGDPLRPTLVPALSHVRDLESLNGPLLSEFVSLSGDPFLYYWCDYDRAVNRWMFFRTTRRTVLRLTVREATIRQAIEQAPDRIFYFRDIGADGRETRQMSLATFDEIPPDYLPGEDSFLESDEARDPAVSPVFIDKDWAAEDFADFMKDSRQAYSFLYQQHGKAAREKFSLREFRGGHSRNHFVREIVSAVPLEQQLSVESVAYASPGYVLFHGEEHVTSLLGQAVKNVLNSSSVAVHFSAMMGYIRDAKLNEKRERDQELSDGEKKSLSVLLRKLVKSLGMVDYNRVVRQSSGDIFQAVKTVAAYYRILQKLAQRQREGYAEFVSAAFDQPIPPVDEPPVSAARGSGRLTKEEKIIDSILPDFVYALIDGDETIVGRIAESNAIFSLSEYGIESASLLDDGSIQFAAWVTLDGDSGPEKAFFGDLITFDVSGTAVEHDGKWSIEEYLVGNAELTDRYTSHSSKDSSSDDNSLNQEDIDYEPTDE